MSTQPHIPVIVQISRTTQIHRHYPADDPIWRLDQEKRERKAIADMQKELVIWTDHRSQTPFQQSSPLFLRPMSYDLGPEISLS